MWGSSASDRRSRRPRPGVVAPALALALIAAFALAGPTAARTVRAPARDSGRIVNQVRVGPGGIEIEGQPSEDGTPEARGTEVRIGPGGIRVRGPGGHDSESVDVQIPGVRVHAGDLERGEHGTAEVRAFSDIEVPKDEVVNGDVVALFGSVTVEGHVSGDVVAVFGSVRMRPGAVVDGSAVAIGGILEQPAGATVGDETVSLGFLPVSFGLPTLPILLIAIFIGWVLTLVLAWLLSLLFPVRVQRVATTITRNPAGSFFLGLVSLPLCVLLGLLLLVTVVGIPVAMLLPLFYLLAVWWGQIAATYLLGCRIRRLTPGEAPVLGPTAFGSLFVAMFFVVGAVLGAPQGMMMRSLALFFSLLGLLLLTGLSILGTGAFLLSRAGSPAREPRLPAPAQAPGPGPLATPPPVTG